MATSLKEAFEENVRPFIDIVDELRSLGLDKDVALPAVVVVGDQSAGKSSVLEAISGVELPRGTNIVTRCPLELRLKKLRKITGGELLDEEETEEKPFRWKATISYKTEDDENVKEDIENRSAVGMAVAQATSKLTASDQGISSSLIHLEVQSETVPDLTLIDLPGIARVAVEGQSPDVPEMIKTLVNKYIQKEQTIILAVIPCNVDIATTEALQLAQQVDPDGKRTLGVLTKPDLMDEGTEADICRIVNGEKVKLKLGYTVVKCRGQKAIDNNMTLEDAIKNEEKFFKNHETFNILYEDKKTGVKNLSHQLTKQLVEQIKEYIPSLKNDINEKLSSVNKELEKYGEGLPLDDHERQNYLFKLLMKLGELLKRLAKAEQIEDESLNTLRLYARVKKEFAVLADEIRQIKPDRKDATLKQGVAKEIKRQKGKELPSFLSYTVFEGIVRQHVQKIKSPAKECLNRVNAIVDSTASATINKCLNRFEPLMIEVNKLVNEGRKRAEENTNGALNTIFAMENLVFTQDANFTRFMKVIEEEDEAEEQSSSTETSIVKGIVRSLTKWLENGEKLDTDHMAKCLEAYCEVAATRMVDTIPMAIYYHLVKELLERMATDIVKIAVQPDAHKELLREDPEIVFMRDKLLEKQCRLEKANIKLMKFGATSTPAAFDPDDVDGQDGENDVV